MFERFNEGARQVIVCAQEVAREFDAQEIDVAHLMLGVARSTESTQRGRRKQTDAARVLKRFSNPKRLIVWACCHTKTLTNIGGSDLGRVPSPHQIPFTDAAKEVLSRALRSALGFGHTDIRPGHILIALLDTPEVALLWYGEVKHAMVHEWMPRGEDVSQS